MLHVCEGGLVVVCEESIFFSCWTQLSLWRPIKNATQLFFNRILQMNKYFIARECEHIGDTSICSQEGISIFKFPERFLEISFRDLTFSLCLQL
jgi:hypothetical protein